MFACADMGGDARANRQKQNAKQNALIKGEAKKEGKVGPQLPRQPKTSNDILIREAIGSLKAKQHFGLSEKPNNYEKLQKVILEILNNKKRPKKFNSSIDDTGRVLKAGEKFVIETQKYGENILLINVPGYISININFDGYEWKLIITNQLTGKSFKGKFSDTDELTEAIENFT